MPEITKEPPLQCAACGGSIHSSSGFEAVDRLHRVSGQFRVVVCADCGSGTTTPIVSATELKSYYPATYGPYDEPTGRLVGLVSKAIRWWQLRRALNTFPLRALGDGGRGIDVGCGRGDLAGGLIAHGWHMTGVEPSREAATIAARRGVDVRVGTLGNVELEPGSYDAAVFRHSLEHTTDPLEDLRLIRDALTPSGIVAITVPNFSNWQARRLRSRWYHLDVPRHRTHFTERGISRLLERAGFDVLALRTSTSAVGLPASIQYRVAGRCLFPDGFGLRVATGLCALALPLAIAADQAGGGGDQLSLVARPATPG